MKRVLVSRHASRLAAVAICAALAIMARKPTLTASEHTELASHFKFSKYRLPEVPGAAIKHIRRVHPRLERIAAWVSSMGAAAALHDLDGDGLSNDVCYADTRSDQVIVAAVPTTGSRYAPFALSVARIRWDETMAPTGCLPGDVNEDGRADIIVYFYGRTPVVYLNNGTKPLSNASYTVQEITSSTERWNTNTAMLADLDGDGHLDLYVGNYFKDGAEILNPTATSDVEMHDKKSKAYNGGRDHVFVWQDATGGPDPRVTFHEASDVIDDAISREWTMAVGALDLDGDMLPELYLANDLGPDQLLHNITTKRGEPRFAPLKGVSSMMTPSSYVLGKDSFKGMGTDFGDVNGDGILDIYVSNISEAYAFHEAHFLWLSTGDRGAIARGYAPYVQASDRLGLSQSGWAWDSRLADFDDDGTLEALQAVGFIKGKVNRWPELQALGTGNDAFMNNPRFWPHLGLGDDISGHDPNAFFVRGKDGRYYDIASEIGIDDRNVTRALALADVDGDGAIDFVCGNQFEPAMFYKNESPRIARGNPSSAGNTFLGLHLLLPLAGSPIHEVVVRDGHPAVDTPGRPAVGAIVNVRMADGRVLVSQVDGGSGHSGKRSPDVHLGLGSLPTGTRVPVSLKWRDGQGAVHDTIVQLAAGWHTILLGSQH